MNKSYVAVFFYIMLSCILLYPSQIVLAEGFQADSLHDTNNLRLNASFNIEVAEGVYWIPVNELGDTRYTNIQIAEMVNWTPERKKTAVKTLFEAIQLYQISQFKGVYDNQRIIENEVNWEHHKPGYDAVRTNEGCCASNTSWLNYLLENDYEETGACCFGINDGNGHIINYFKHNEWYYFIDMMQYRPDSLPMSGIETGQIKDYLRAYDPASGSLHRAKTIKEYALYCRASMKKRPEYFVSYRNSGQECVPLTSNSKDGIMYFCYPEDVSLKIIFLEPEDTKVGLEYLNPPKLKPDWSSIPTATISPIIP